MADIRLNWTCPHCNRPQTATERSIAEVEEHFYMEESSVGPLGILAVAACCANPKCRMPTVRVVVQSQEYKSGNWQFCEDTPLFERRVFPESRAKPQPEYIPEVLRNDYNEACMIRDLSPKASATLARRCLQGMIRDFANIKAKSLYHEIEELKRVADEGSAPKGVSHDSVEALHHVRSLGNIGAHMESDINIVVPVDAGEAQVLIELLESLFEEWYVARFRREERFAKIKGIADEKKQIKNGNSPQA